MRAWACTPHAHARCALDSRNAAVLPPCTQALRLTMVQVLINSKGYNMNPLQSLYYVSPACMFSLFPAWLLNELGQLRTRTDWVFNPSVLLANAVTAFILNLVGAAGVCASARARACV
jgi:hypothetical protein